MIETFKDFGGLFSGAVVGLAGLVLGLRKMTKVWSTDGRDISRVKGEVDVIELLRTQLGMVVQQNITLGAEIMKLHDLIIELRGENAKLTASVHNLNGQIADIRIAANPT